MTPSALGDITRGTTNPNRLRRIDRWMLHAVCPIIRSSQDPIVVDLGYGATPVTTQEMFLRFRKHVRSDVEVVDRGGAVADDGIRGGQGCGRG